MAYLNWIDDESLIRAVERLANSVATGRERARRQFGRNVIDPFAAQFSMLLSNSDIPWEEFELHRQIDKSLTNAIGSFHQQILGRVNGWRDLNNNTLVDIVNDDRMIIAELKNKFNTLNAAGTVKLYNTLSELVNHRGSMYNGYTAYYVTIIPKTPLGYNVPFCPSDNATGQRLPSLDNIRIIDGKSFYTLVTDDSDALRNLFLVIPQVIIDNNLTPFATEIDQELLQDLYLRAFGE